MEAKLDGHWPGDLSRYTFGTTRLGDESIPFEDRVAIAGLAMSSGVWMHTSHAYGNALSVLRAAFDKDPQHIPPAIFKIGWDSIEQIEEVIHQNIDPLGVSSMAIGQLCLNSKLAEEFANGGPIYDGLRMLKEKGLVGKFVLEVWPWNSDVPVRALRSGLSPSIVDAHIFYLNPLQRFVSDELWDLLTKANAPIIAMRTVCGGSVHKLRDSESAPAYLRDRARDVAPIFERSGCGSWTEFCVRFALGFTNVLTTVGSTWHAEHLQAFLSESRQPSPLNPEIQQSIISLQRRWFAEHDINAEPWSM